MRWGASNGPPKPPCGSGRPGSAGAALVMRLAEDHALERLGVAEAAALAVAQRPRFQELIDPLALVDLRAVRLERAALRRQRAGDVQEGVGGERAADEHLLHLVGLQTFGQQLRKDRAGLRRRKDGVERGVG